MQLIGGRVYWEVPIFIFLATSMSYSILQSPLHSKIKPKSPRLDWYRKYHLKLKPLIIIELLALLGMCFFFKMGELLFFAHLGLLVLLYDTIFAFIRFPLRQIPYLKSIIISYVWSMAITFPAVSMAEASYKYTIECFIFIWCLTMVFDLRDITTDKELGLKTFISLIGEHPIRLILVLIFLADSIYFSTQIVDGVWWPSAIGVILFSIGVFKIKDRISDHVLVFGIDSLILLRTLNWLS